MKELNTAFAEFQRNVQNHGYSPATYDLAVRCINKMVLWKELQCLVIEEPDAKYIELALPFQYRRLGPEELNQYAGLREYELDGEFLKGALEKGDECHAILSGDVLASYGWYSQKPTAINADLRLTFSTEYIYMYKGFTHPRFRGHRLHAIGMTLALTHYKSQGYKGLLSYVEAQNFDSLKSCYRMGYLDCGTIRFVKLSGQYYIRNKVGKPYGLKLAPIATI